jgi:hypothetical protein
MTASNHVLTGSVFAAATINHLPVWVILPVAFLLHFVLDSLPHFGDPNDERGALTRLKWFLPLDAALAATILIVLCIVRPEHWQVFVLAGVLCASPDLWSATRFIRFLKTGQTHLNNDWFAHFHHRIQWGERLWGGWLEAAWFATFALLLWVHL